VRIAADGTVTLIVAKSEIGQGIYGSLPLLLADELGLDWKAVRMEHAPSDPRIYDSGTGGSGSVSDSWLPLRQAGAAASESDATLRRQFTDLAAKPGKPVVEGGDTEAALGKAARTLEASYELPFLAHASMEPMNCTADVRADRAQVWAPSQSPDWNRDMVARVTGLNPEAVTVHTVLSGGGFGRRYQTGFAVEAAQVSHAVKAPVKLLWTREDDMQHDFYRPASYQGMRAGLDANGLPVAWHHRLLSTSIRAYWDPPDRVKPERQELG
jgi:isoquinoline 1-oxidoreductase beta subunit